MTGGRSSRTGDDHVHPDAWSKADHNRFEDRMNDELEKIEKAVGALTLRVTLMLGALMFIATLLPIISPFIRAWLDIPSGQ